MRKAKEYLALLAVLAAICGVSFFFGSAWQAGKKPLVSERKEITEDLLNQEVLGIAELAAAKYYYTNMGKFENQLQFAGKDVPFTKKAFIISYDGVIKAGIHLDEIAVRVSGKQIIVKLPKAQILSHEIVDGSVTVFDERYNIFNGLSASDVTDFQKEQKELMEEKAAASGVLDDAGNNTREALRVLLGKVISDPQYEEGYQLKFED